MVTHVKADFLYLIISDQVQLVKIRLRYEDERKCRLWWNIMVSENKIYKNSWLDWTVQKIKFKNLTKTLDSYSSENEFINTKNYLQITEKTKIVMRSQPVSIKSYKSCLIFVVVSILFYFYYSDLTLWAGLRIRSNFNQIRIQIFRKTEIQIQSSYIRKENDHYLFSFLGN